MAKKKAVKRKNSPNSGSKEKLLKKWQAAPLKGSFMATAMLGFLISAYWVYPQSFNYGLTFMLVFTLMFIASFISMTKAPAVNERY